MQKRLRLRSILAPLPDRRAIAIEDERKRRAEQGQKRRNRRRPVDAQVVVHVRREQREDGREDGAHEDSPRQNRRGEDGVRVEEIVHNPDHHQDHPESERHSGGDADHPVDVGTVGPGEPEQA